MEKYGKGNKSGASSKPEPMTKGSGELSGKGSMDYMAKQEKFQSGDIGKIKGHQYKHKRYD